MVKEVELLIGKLARISQAFRPIYHLMPHLYASVAYALWENKAFLVSTSRQFQKILKKARSSPPPSNDAREVTFVVNKTLG